MKKIAFIEMNFPYITTFMASEMWGFKKRGVEIVIMPIILNSYDQVQDVYHQLRENVHYPPFFGFRNLTAFCYFLATRPGRLFATLWQVVSEIRRPGKYVLQTWAILFKAMYCARYVMLNGIGHIHGNWAHNPTTIAYIIHRLTDIPYTFSSHAGADIYRNVDMLPVKIDTSLFSFTCVRQNRDFFEQLMGKKLDNKVHVIYHGIDISKFQPKTQADVATIQPPYLFLSVGNLHEPKGFHFMIEACALLKQERVPFSYYVVGKGHYLESLVRLSESLELQNEVIFTGQILHHELLEIYRKAHVFIMPSVVLVNGGRDGIPNVLIEAMATGVPVVASRAAGIPEAVSHEVSGLLVPPSDPPALASAIQTVIANSELRVRLVTEARCFVEKHFERDQNFTTMFRIMRNQALG